MKFTLSWLKDHLETQASLDEITTKLSAIGLEVDAVEDPGAALNAFRIARVLEAKPHPDADRLQVLQVEIETGKPPVEVVCGAPNARAGMLGVFAPIGTYVPGLDLTLVEKPVRGVVSNGMMCSAAEMQLSDEAEGIIEVDDAHAGKVGVAYVEAMGLDDVVIDVGLTPNRPDCTGVRGIARDLAAAGLGKLKPEPETGAVEGKAAPSLEIKLEFAKGFEDACPVFAGRVVSGVKNGPSPEWMQNRLKAIGLRPINALVDVTNYISYDRGRPLHVYDLAKLKGCVRARLGKTGESFEGLDGKTYQVDETMCVIADDSGPLGFGGIMGGEASGCTDETTDVLIESAWFDPVRTAKTGRATGIVSDARYRFERGVDPLSVLPGLDLATDMIVKICGGTPSKSVLAGSVPKPEKAIAFDPGLVKRLAGLDTPVAEAKRILSDLGFRISGSGAKLKVSVPSWRPDIEGAADLVEEVVRIVGIDAMTSTPLPRERGVAGAQLTSAQRRARRVRRALAGRGFVEAITWSFVAPEHARLFGGGQDDLEIANPISSEMSVMRPGLLPGLVTAVQRNRNRGIDDLALFELGQAYRGAGETAQYLSACGIRAGRATLAGNGRHWDLGGTKAGVFDAKADAMAALAALGIDGSKAQVTRDAPEWYHPGRSGTLRLGPKMVLAHFGELHPRTLKTLDVDGSLAAFEIFLDALPPEKKKSGRTRPALAVTDLMPVTRDFAFVVDKDIEAADLLKAAGSVEKKLISAVNIFDVFDGAPLGERGKKSIGLEITLQPSEATLTDKEIDAVAEKVIAAVTKATGGEIRG